MSEPTHHDRSTKALLRKSVDLSWKFHRVILGLWIPLLRQKLPFVTEVELLRKTKGNGRKGRIGTDTSTHTRVSSAQLDSGDGMRRSRLRRRGRSSLTGDCSLHTSRLNGQGRRSFTPGSFIAFLLFSKEHKLVTLVLSQLKHQ